MKRIMEIFHISFTHKTNRARAYLSRNPSSSHLKSCSYNFPYASKKIIYNYIDTLTAQQLQDRLEAALNMLMKKKDGTLRLEGESDKKTEENPLLVPTYDEKKTNIFNAIRRKSLNTWIDESDGTDTYIFYGKVKLKTEKLTGKKAKEDGSYPEYNLLRLFTMNKKGEWKFKTSIYRGKHADEVDEGKIYEIAVLGHLDFTYRYMEIKVDYRDAVLYRMCKE